MSKVQSALQSIAGVEGASVQLMPPEASITTQQAIGEAVLNAALAKAGAYSLVAASQAFAMPIPATQAASGMEGGVKGGVEGFERIQPTVTRTTVAPQAALEGSSERSWFATYKPLLLVMAFIVGGVVLVQINNGVAQKGIDWMLAMNTFMGGFFIVFSFFKLLDVQAFADSYSMYDVLARAWRGWGVVYPFVELTLGVAYLTQSVPLATNLVTLAVMSVSIVGVIQSRLNKRAIQCACLGAVFNLPMSSVTIIEDGVMLAMSAWMLVLLR